MVAAQYVGADEGAFEARAQRGAEQEIINAPPNVSGAYAGHLTPPGVMPAAFLEFAKRVEEAGLHERAEAGAFLGREAVVLDVGFGVGEVNLGVRRIEIAAEDYRIFLFQFLEVTEKGAIPLLAIGEAGEFAFGVGHIGVHEKELGELRGEHAALLVV